MSVTNLLITIHGINPCLEPKDLTEDFKKLFDSMVAQRPMLNNLFPSDHRIYIQWGHPPNENSKENIFTIGRAQAKILKLLDYDKSERTNNDIKLNKFFPNNLNVSYILSKLLRENFVLTGLGDAAYYCSEEGENEVRSYIYEIILRKLEELKKKNSRIRIHFIGHSLGVAICHDILFGLSYNGQNYEPGFLKNALGKEDLLKLFKFWRQEMLSHGKLEAGSFISLASQLPLFIQRKHDILKKFINEENYKLDLTDIGISGTQLKWLLFYDLNDLLGFRTRPLYHDPNKIVKEIEVDCGVLPDSAHLNYFKNPTVIWESAKLLEMNGI